MSSLLTCALLVNSSLVMGQIRVPVGQEPTSVCQTSRPVPPFPANAEQVASALSILPLVQRPHAGLPVPAIRRYFSRGTDVASADNGESACRISR
jgi:hypothetical protein